MTEKIIVEFGSLTIMEPMSVVWNWLIAVFCVLAYLKLDVKASEAVKEWRLFFIVFAFSAFFGGLGHGLYHYFGQAGKVLPWVLGIVAIYFSERGLYAFIPDKNNLKNKLHLFSTAKMVMMLAGMAFISFDFIWAKNNSIIGLVLIVGLGGYLLSKKDPDLIFLPWGVLVLTSAAVVHGLDINPHVWFNRDDLAHLIMFAGLVFFYIAIRKHQQSVTNVAGEGESGDESVYDSSYLK